jgi:hypothetical protein
VTDLLFDGFSLKNDMPYDENVQMFFMLRTTNTAWNIYQSGHYLKSKQKKAVPLHAMVAFGGRGGIAPTHS